MMSLGSDARLKTPSLRAIHRNQPPSSGILGRPIPCRQPRQMARGMTEPSVWHCSPLLRPASGEVLDGLVELLIQVTHRITVKAERRVVEELVEEAREVRGKAGILFGSPRPRLAGKKVWCARSSSPLLASRHSRRWSVKPEHWAPRRTDVSTPAEGLCRAVSRIGADLIRESERRYLDDGALSPSFSTDARHLHLAPSSFNGRQILLPEHEFDRPHLAARACVDTDVRAIKWASWFTSAQAGSTTFRLMSAQSRVLRCSYAHDLS